MNSELMMIVVGLLVAVIGALVAVLPRSHRYLIPTLAGILVTQYGVSMDSV